MSRRATCRSTRDPYSAQEAEPLKIHIRFCRAMHEIGYKNCRLKIMYGCSRTVLFILGKLSSSHCLPNFCQKFTRRFPVFTKSGENLSIHALRAHYVAVLTADWYWYHPCSCALCGLPKVYSWIPTVYLNSELRFPVFT